MITIILPTYNADLYLVDCMRSIIAQTYKDWELIVVDSESTDSTPNLLEHYAKDKRIKYISKKSTIQEARNIALKEAKGKYIATMSSDDMMPSDRLELSLKAIKGVDVVYSDYAEMDVNGKFMGIFVAKDIKNFTLDQIIENQTVPHDTIMARRECFKHTYRENGRLDDDHYLIAKWFKEGFKFKKMKEPVLMKRYHGNQHYRVNSDGYQAKSEKLKEEL